MLGYKQCHLENGVFIGLQVGIPEKCTLTIRAGSMALAGLLCFALTQGPDQHAHCLAMRRGQRPDRSRQIKIDRQRIRFGNHRIDLALAKA